VADSQSVEIEGRVLRLTNLDKPLYPDGFTKAQVIDYYVRVAGPLVRQIEGRPLTLKRYPNGVKAPFFYEKNCPKHRPDWVSTVQVPRQRGAEESIDYCVVDGVATLVWLANLAALELHPLLARGTDVEHPTTMVFDLDPGLPADVLTCAEVAGLVRSQLATDGLEAWPKTSGSKGLQVYVPLDGRSDYEATKSYARTLADRLARAHPRMVVDRMDKSLRKGKVFIDWSQNHVTKTTVAAYSLRATDQPRVSTPVEWEELDQALSSRDGSLLSFGPAEVIARLEDKGDLFEPVAERVQPLSS
jgi:bifunctional non-homologous end joining protein LigD